MEFETKDSPLLSILIATRNRIPYAISAIKCVLEIPDSRLELVVQDNSDSRELESYISDNIKDKRLIYNYTPTPLSMIGNFNAVVELANGEYLCIIGDDDGVNPEIIEAACWAKSEDLDSLAVKNKIGYIWQGTTIPSTLFTKNTSESFSIPHLNGSITSVDIEKEMRKLVRNGGVYYLNFNMPKLYHGLVHRRCLKTVKEKTGAFFGGLSPDIFVSLAIACVAKRVMVTDYPLTIPGMCKVSGAAVEGMVKKHSKKLEDAPHFRNRGEYHWCELVPRIYIVQTIWVESCIAALKAMGRDDLVQQLNLPKLAMHCIAANKGIAGYILRDMFLKLKIMHNNPAIGTVQFAWYYAINAGMKIFRRAWNRFLMIIGRKTVYRINGLKNMVEVSHALKQYLKDNGYSFMDCVRRRSTNI